jgi:hypothetical protein
LGNLIILNIELNALRSFLSVVLNASGSEYSKIQHQSDAGAFSNNDDKDNALFGPMMWEEIACKAVLGELNALFEWELQCVASSIKPFPKTKRTKLLSDLSIKDLIKLIEKFYNIQFKEIDSYDAIMSIRNKVNSFKHRKGFKHPFKDKTKVFPEKFEISPIDALESIDLFGRFFKELYSKTKNHKMAFVFSGARGACAR